MIGFLGAATFHAAASHWTRDGLSGGVVRAAFCLAVLLLVALMARRRIG